MLCPACHRDFEDSKERYCPYDGEALTSVPELELVPSKPTPDVGSVYGKRYIVRGLLGTGSMARVYLAEDALTHKLAAVKVLETPDARMKDARERFFREVRTTEALEHPNIVRLLDAGARRDGAPYLVMEYLFGESLGALLRRETRLDQRATLVIARQTASALAAAHAAGVIHRDVKPDNIFLLGAQGRPHGLKVVDFGLARLQGQSGLTAMGVTVGTLEYMAPEQVVKDPTGPGSDMYALGVVMYRALTGSLPFGGTDTEVLAHQLLTPPPAPSSLAPDLDAGVEAVIMTALRKLPFNRYPSMEDFLEDLDRLLGERAGQLAAGTTLENDVYVPQSAYAKNVARALYKKLGRLAPDWS
jgi:eukaryotic-like serine/threonine-protein kinase